jgi:hypothetical protein
VKTSDSLADDPAQIQTRCIPESKCRATWFEYQLTLAILTEVFHVESTSLHISISIDATYVQKWHVMVINVLFIENILYRRKICITISL